MSIFKVNKNKDYTCLSNYHFRDKRLSLKAKGLLSLMLSLPEDWNYSIEGLEELSSDGNDSVRSGLKELENNGYLIREPIKENGKIVDWKYDIYEKPIVGKPVVENPHVEKPQVGNQSQYNTNIYNTKELNTNNIKKEIYKEKKEYFKKPTILEIQEYCTERKNSIKPETFYNYYEANGWLVGKNKMKDWKATVRYWETNGRKPESKPFNNLQDTQLVKTEEGTFKLR